MVFSIQKRAPEVRAGVELNLHQKSTLENVDNSTQPPSKPILQDMKLSTIEEEHAEQPHQMSGKFLNEKNKCFLTNDFLS